MIKIVIPQKSAITVEFEGVDGQFQIHFDSPQHPNEIMVAETAGLPGNIKGNGTLYIERFGTPPINN